MLMLLGIIPSWIINEAIQSFYLGDIDISLVIDETIGRYLP